MKDNQRKAMWAKLKLYKVFIKRGKRDEPSERFTFLSSSLGGARQKAKREILFRGKDKILGIELIKRRSGMLLDDQYGREVGQDLRVMNNSRNRYVKNRLKNR